MATTAPSRAADAALRRCPPNQSRAGCSLRGDGSVGLPCTLRFSHHCDESLPAADDVHETAMSLGADERRRCSSCGWARCRTGRARRALLGLQSGRHARR